MDNNIGKTIPITIDKSHLITIGERLYSQSLELIRELVSNAYDADATQVWIEVTPYTLIVKDNGSGMDEAGLRQFFNIGSPEKRYNKKTPIFQRIRIGEFGIGKFSVLSACDIFEIYTQKGEFAAKVTFDKNLWNNIAGWEVPIHFMAASRFAGNGTIVALERLKKILTLPDIERFIHERVPLKIPNFAVYLNGKRIMPLFVAGRKFRLHRESSFGLIYGEIIIPSFQFVRKNQEKGLECFVNDVFIKRESFSFEESHLFATHHLTGEIHADFLPITSDRTRFMTDTNEYQEFSRLMRQEIESILQILKKESGMKDGKKADHIIKDALSHIKKALQKNPEFTPQTFIPLEDKKSKKEAEEKIKNSSLEENPLNEESNPVLSSTNEKKETPVLETLDALGENNSLLSQKINSLKKQDRSSKKIRVKTLMGKEITARKMEVGSFSVVCQAEKMGQENPPVISEGGVIFINRDHPLYKRFTKNPEALTLFVTKLISQEIAKVRASDLENAFFLQNKIITDAWV